MRDFNYLRDRVETGDLIRLVREYHNILIEYCDNQLLSEKQIKLFSNKVASFLHDYDVTFPNDLSSRINNELLDPAVVNNLQPPHYQYPHDASLLGCEVEIRARELFSLEDSIAEMVAKVWNDSIKGFSSFENGQDFSFVATVTSNPEQFPGGRYYRKNGHPYTCATLFTNNMLDSFQDGKLLLITDVNTDNFLGASEVDIATREESYPSIKTLGKVDNQYIGAGYSGSGSVCTKLLTPDLLEKRRLQLNKSFGNSINEVILDKEKTNYTGIILFSDGCDCLIGEYLTALEARETMNLDFKCLNKMLYQPSIVMPEQLQMLNDNLDYYISFCEYNYGLDTTKNILSGYIEDVVKPMKYSDEVENVYLSKVGRYESEMSGSQK